MCRHCCRHRHCHRAGKQWTGDDAKASLSALLLPTTRTSVHCCRCNCHRAGERGIGNDAEASMPTLLPLSLRYVVCSTAVLAIARASKGLVMMPKHPHCRCRRHCHCHRTSKQGTGDDAKVSSPALLLSSICTSVHPCRCHRHCAGEQGTGDDTKSSSPALLPLSACTRVRTTAATTIAWASEGQVMMLRHHHPPCCRR